METEFDYAKTLTTDTSIDLTLVEDDSSAEYDPRQAIYYLVEKIGVQRLVSLVLELCGESESCIDTISRNEAIDSLKDEVRLIDGYYTMDDEVINKDDAIEAIRLLPSVQPERKKGKRINNNMDLINREDAMQSRPEYLHEYVVRDDKEKEIYDRAFAKGWNECSDQWLDNIRDLPSVQPELTWETCFDCPLSNGCPKISGCTNDQAEQYASEIPADCPLNKASVQPERKKGKWILDDDGTPSICSECGTNWMNDYVDSRELYFTGKIPNYCPNCGSDNRCEHDD